ncbi:hypothetical protein O6H91_06G076000 [Diphasiastrum complanatum]|uniref:Uncharacterized protein n=1 Tax=Diphasiastrum complanatum TaxID=34168 RepID=A0ACC2DFE7_DIPCM|nr:hypothetical protein O6H91_06G076000 [Diphasiastrum complanatum]
MAIMYTNSSINSTGFFSVPRLSSKGSGFYRIQPFQAKCKHSMLYLGMEIKRRPLTVRSTTPTEFTRIGEYGTREVETKPALTEIIQDNLPRGRLEDLVETVRKMLRSMDDGDISISAYDTAWVAVVPSLDEGSEGPQFPKCVEWIIHNQLPDGSWGDPHFFLAFDRICSTLACVVALSTWKVGSANVQKGVSFIHRELQAMELGDDVTHMPVDFEIVFPAILEKAKSLNIEIPYNAPIIKRILAMKEEKLKRISINKLHETPSALLYSLEGLSHHVDWTKILRLKFKNGSFFNSPASTACVLMHTRDRSCQEYLSSILQKFGSAVPNAYPVDLFERLWVVDRLERLGISRYFKQEIRDALDYVYRYWTPKGIGWGRETSVQDVDDTAMAFRLLRLHGYDVSADVFSHFEKDGEFFAFYGQIGQATAGMLHLYGASQLQFPEEVILEEAKLFTRNFLERSRRNGNTLSDKWVIKKDLAEEVNFALDFPWCATLQRIETWKYMQLYGTNDPWIGKSVYRMNKISNDIFLNLAKADCNLCQSNFQKELQQIYSWNQEMQFSKLEFSRQKALECYFTAAATSFEPEMACMRFVWTRCCVLTTVIDDLFDVGASLNDLKKFVTAVKSWNLSALDNLSADMKTVFAGLYNTTNDIIQEGIRYQGSNNISAHLHKIWIRLVESFLKEAEWTQSGQQPTIQEYTNVSQISIALEPIVLTSAYFVGELLTDEIVAHPDYERVMQLVSRLGRLLNDIQGYKRESQQGKPSSISIYMREYQITEEEAIYKVQNETDYTMKQLVSEVIRPTKVPRACKQLHLNLAKILHFMYAETDGFSSNTAMKNYVKGILFDPVE